MAHWVYLFEAKGIQRFLFHSGKLRDVIGASDLVAGLARGDTKDEIGNIAGALGFGESHFSRRAGGAFCIHGTNREQLARLRGAWRAHLFANLPGLEFSDALSEGETPYAAMIAGFAEAGGLRCNYASQAWPLGRPVNRFAPRTGLPAVEEDRHDGLIDLIGAAPRARSRELISGHNTHTSGFADDYVLQRFVTAEKQAAGLRFPVHFDPADLQKGEHDPVFPPRPAPHQGNRRFAIVHADLSGLGELFRSMGARLAQGDGYVAASLALSQSIEAAITLAAQDATTAVLLDAAVDQVVPARPILLGGDDVTILVRADLALAYTAALVAAIEARCKDIGVEDGLALSACAGVAIVGPKTPFLSANALAEALCQHAKAAVKNAVDPKLHGRKGYASALSFYVQQQSAQEGLPHIEAANCDAMGQPLWGNPWIVGAGEVPGRCHVEDLLAVTRALAAIEGGHNIVREVRQLMTTSPTHARARLSRWRQMLDRRQQDRLLAMEALFGGVRIDADSFSPAASGLFDAAILIDVGHLASPAPLAAAA